MSERPHLRWRDYRSSSGNSPVREFIAKLSDVDHAAVIAAMKEVQHDALAAARHVEGDVYEVRAVGHKAHYCILFSLEGKRVLLALDIYDKDSQKLPLNVRRRCQQRLRDWRSRA